MKYVKIGKLGRALICTMAISLVKGCSRLVRHAQPGSGPLPITLPMTAAFWPTHRDWLEKFYKAVCLRFLPSLSRFLSQTLWAVLKRLLKGFHLELMSGPRRLLPQHFCPLLFPSSFISEALIFLIPCITLKAPGESHKARQTRPVTHTDLLFSLRSLRAKLLQPSLEKEKTLLFWFNDALIVVQKALVKNEARYF